MTSHGVFLPNCSNKPVTISMFNYYPKHVQMPMANIKQQFPNKPNWQYG